MAKIKSVSYRINGVDVSFTLKYSVGSLRSSGYFYVELPAWMAGVLKKDMVRADTQYGAENALRSAIDKYGQLLKTEEKVIFYKFLSMVRPLGFDDSHGVSANVSGGEMLSSGVALDFWYMVGYIITDPTETGKIRVNEQHEGISSWHSNNPYMAYTPERETFCKAFREWLISGITKMRDFFNNEQLVPQLMEAAIRGNQLPFIPEQEAVP